MRYTITNTNRYGDCYSDSDCYNHTHSDINAQSNAHPKGSAYTEVSSHSGTTPIGFTGVKASSGDRLPNAVQAFGEHFRVHAHADSKVIGHFEEAARDR